MKGAKQLLVYLAVLLTGKRDLAPILDMPLDDEAREYLLTMERDWQVALLEHCLTLAPGKYRRDPPA
jgi:hypothetical protein